MAGIAALPARGAGLIAVATVVAVLLMATWASLLERPARLVRVAAGVLGVAAVMATGVAVGQRTHSYSSIEALPAPTGSADVAWVLNDPYDEPTFRLNGPGFQLLLGDLGWSNEFRTAGDPGDPPADVGLVVSSGPRPPESGRWSLAATSGDLRFWARSEP